MLCRSVSRFISSIFILVLGSFLIIPTIANAQFNEGSFVVQPGDANMDGRLDISDSQAISSFLFGGEVATPCYPAADVNNSGRVDIADAIYLAKHLFLGEPAPLNMPVLSHFCNLPFDGVGPADIAPNGLNV